MPTPRHQLIDRVRPLCYHLVSNCVRGAHLCGVDELTGRDYSHRKEWIVERLHQLAPAFPVEVFAYAVMSNHLHIIVHYDPTASHYWSDREVAQRWIQASGMDPEAIDQLLDNPKQLKKLRERLGSLSAFMQQLKQPIALRANKEDRRRGHFFEQRFYSGALLGETSLLASMLYVDLNPVRAKLAKTIEQCQHTSVEHRLEVLENSKDKLAMFLEPVVSGFEPPPEPFPTTTNVSVDETPRSHAQDNGTTTESTPPSRRRRRPPPSAFSQPVKLANYITQLRSIIAGESLDPGHAPPPQPNDAYPEPSKVKKWAALVAALGKRQRAYGSKAELHSWLDARGMRHLERPLPDI